MVLLTMFQHFHQEQLSHLLKAVFTEYEIFFAENLRNPLAEKDKLADLQFNLIPGQQ